MGHLTRQHGPMHPYPINGAAHRAASETAWNAKESNGAMVIAGVDADPRKAPELGQWARRYWAAIHAHSEAGGYVNFMMDDGDHQRMSATYGANYERLVAHKTKYDPTNFFRENQNIPSSKA